MVCGGEVLSCTFFLILGYDVDCYLVRSLRVEEPITCKLCVSYFAMWGKIYGRKFFKNRFIAFNRLPHLPKTVDALVKAV